MNGKALRFRRFTRRGGTVVVPLDHGLFSEPAPAMADLRKLVKVIAQTEADGVLITPGLLEYVQPVIGDLNVVLRIDGTHTRLGKHLERTDLITSVEQAVSLGADMVVTNVFVGTDNENVLLAKLGGLATDCRRFGMPLMAEMLPITLLEYHYGKSDKTATMDQINKDVCLAARLGAEIGADCIKSQYPGDKKGFEWVTSCTPVPYWIAGGPKGKTSDKEFLDMISEAVSAGAKGVVIGRNVWQRDNVKEMIEDLCSILHN
jgi:fructose-bisphosphate aldolase/2-amino-3,7-dideoxy-D-threo-hept-6-ulosonate synthase